MKKVGIVSLLCLLLLGGCGSFDYEMMVCDYKSMQFKSYEIRYSGHDVKNIVLVEYTDLREVPDDVYESRLEQMQKRIKIQDKYAGISTYLEDDNREVFFKTVIDIDDYDCYKDSLNLLFFNLTKEDLESVETLRNVFLSHSFECDELVTFEMEK